MATVDDTAAPEGPAPILFAAIVRKLCVTATYNRVVVTLAPHAVYTRHGDLHVDAVTLDRDGKLPKEVKLGVFKVAGLNDLRLAERRFSPSPLFNLADPKYIDEMLLAVESN